MSLKTTKREHAHMIEWSTILDKTVEKILYLDSIFLNIVAVPVLPSPPSPESNVVVYSKKSLIPGRLWEATLNWGKGFSFRKGVVLEIFLLRRKVDMMGKTFSSSFVGIVASTLRLQFALSCLAPSSLSFERSNSLPFKLSKRVKVLHRFLLK